MIRIGDNDRGKVGKRLCLEFANTVYREKDQYTDERLIDFSALLDWGREALVLTELHQQELLVAVEACPEAVIVVFERAIALREALYRIFSAVSGGPQPEAADLATLNAELFRAYSHLQIQPTEGGGFAWQWVGAEVALDAVLWSVACSAAELLASDELDRVRECANPSCSLLFFDLSRNRSRRWCAMDHCGSQLKARRYYNRRKQRTSR